MSSINVLIADDHRLFRETLAGLLGTDQRFRVNGACSCYTRLQAAAEESKPGVIVLNPNLLPADGITAIGEISRWPGIRIIILSVFNHPGYVKRMINAGAAGFLTRNSPKEELADAILTVSGGRRYICNEIKNAFVNDMLDVTAQMPNLSILTTRETEVVLYVRNGMSSRQIAELLQLSCKTVEVHRHRILKKLKLRNSASLINFINQHPEALAMAGQIIV